MPPSAQSAVEIVTARPDSGVGRFVETDSVCFAGERRSLTRGIPLRCFPRVTATGLLVWPLVVLTGTAMGSDDARSSSLMRSHLRERIKCTQPGEPVAQVLRAAGREGRGLQPGRGYPHAACFGFASGSGCLCQIARGGLGRFASRRGGWVHEDIGIGATGR